uniref:Uncharacterized protein n=1 Tax=Anguilla anguilla TaxID=7936 RepID=A0A0E9RKZ1_ANGAN
MQIYTMPTFRCVTIPGTSDPETGLTACL